MNKSRPAAALPDRMRSAYTYWWEYRTTRFGRAMLLGLVIIGGFGSAAIEMPLFRLWFTIAAFLGVALLAGVAYRPKLRISSEPPDRAVAGLPLRVDVHLNSTGRLPAWNIAAGFFEVQPALRRATESNELSLARGEKGTLQATLTPLRRGIYSPTLRVYSTFPFGMFRFPRSGSMRRPLLVMPAFQPLGAVDLAVGARYQPGGIALSSNIGESPEYIGNREYRYGDSMRRIDFKAWARLSRPAVREYEEEYYCRIALILDTFTGPRRRPGPEGFPDLEAGISLCAAVADVLARGEYIIDLFAAGPELYVFRAGRHTAHLENVLEILAGVDNCRTDPFREVTPAVVEELGNISAVVGIFLDWDRTREELMRAALDQGCTVKALIVREGATTLPWDSAEFPIQVFTPDEVRSGGIDSV